MTPDWLSDLIDSYDPRPFPREPNGPLPGDLWFASGDSGVRRILALIDMDSRRGVARTALASTEPEIATDSSLAFTAEELGGPFDVVVQTDLVMPVWLKQLDQFVGRLPVPVEQLAQAADHKQFAEALNARRGMAIHGPSDTRVALRDQELEDLWDIAGQCVSDLEEWETESAICDPRVVREACNVTPDLAAVLSFLDASSRGASLGPWTFFHLKQQIPQGRTGTSPDAAAAMSRLQNDLLLALGDAPRPSPIELEWSPEALATDAEDRALIDMALSEAIGSGVRSIDFYTMKALVPRAVRGAPEVWATMGTRRCAVSVRI